MDFISFTQEERERSTRGSNDFFLGSINPGWLRTACLIFIIIFVIPRVCWLFCVLFLFQKRKKCIRHGEGTSLNLTSGSYFWHWRTLTGMSSYIYLNTRQS
jgi:hypothetical protein